MRINRIEWLLVCSLLAVGNVAAGGLTFLENKVEHGGQTMMQTQTNTEVSGEARVKQLNIITAEAGAIVDEREISRRQLDECFISGEITDEIFRRIEGRSYQRDGGIGLTDLRCLKVLHYNFDHEIQVGEMIVNAKLAEELCSIFKELFLAEYEIHSMRLIDDYWTGDGTSSDEASVEANNSSAFCSRVIAGKKTLSRHAYGCAIDINPLQNPCVVYTDGAPSGYPESSSAYVERDAGEKHVITADDICCQIFKAHGYTWGGDWTNPKDYQHFEKRMDEAE